MHIDCFCVYMYMSESSIHSFHFAYKNLGEVKAAESRFRAVFALALFWLKGGM